jgi:hypothetical protein
MVYNNNLLTAIGLLPGGSSFVHVHNYEKGGCITSNSINYKEPDIVHW